MKPRVYLESTVISYLAARPSRDLLVRAHQDVTREWWEKRRGDFDLHISQVVAREISAGDPEAAAERRTVVKGVPELLVSAEVIRLAELLVAEGPLPEKASDDAYHIALAAVHGMRYLVTWNCRHLANAEIIGPINELLKRNGYEPPVICTPEGLMGE